MSKETLGVGMVGYAFMGAAHSQAWRTVPHVFDLPLRPAMAALCGRNAAAVRAAADRLGWAAAETDWRALVKRDDVQLVDICTPGEFHAEVAIAALEAGKHVLCEKPLANTLAEAEAMAAAAARAAAGGVRSMTGFNYRRVPALALARQLVTEGRIGQLRHVPPPQRQALLGPQLLGVEVDVQRHHLVPRRQQLPHHRRPNQPRAIAVERMSLGAKRLPSQPALPMCRVATAQVLAAAYWRKPTSGRYDPGPDPKKVNGDPYSATGDCLQERRRVQQILRRLAAAPRLFAITAFKVGKPTNSSRRR